MKECRVCKQTKELKEFYPCNKGKNTHTSCKLCFKAKTLLQYKEKRTERIAKMKEWQAKNPNLLRVSKREYNKRRYYSDLEFRLTRILRARLRVALKNNYKTGSAVRDLGCSIEQLKYHLETQFAVGMTWENYGLWHIDHKVALANFDLTDEHQLRSAVHFSNLQPMWAKENQSKGNR